MKRNKTLACGALLLAVLLYWRKKKNSRQRSCKVRRINRSRARLGFYKTTFLAMEADDPQQFFKYTRMSVPVFEKLLNLLTPHLTKKKLSDSVSAEERLAVTLHYLSQGSSMLTIAWTYQLGHATVHKIIIEISGLLWQVLSPVYLKPPSTVEEWERISNKFKEKWNFPNCLGAIDGKHVNIQAPSNSGSLYFNYKKTFSIVLLAACDADYNFTLVDVGAYGSQSNDGIFRDSIFGAALDRGEMHLPQAKPLHADGSAVPHVFVADEAFLLKNYIMRPYPGRHLNDKKLIFNYRLSRARRIIENTFGILVARWRILKQSICADVKNIDSYVKATICLHNYIKKENVAQYCPQGFVDIDDTSAGEWRSESGQLISVHRLSSNNASRNAINIREIFMEYFLTPQGELAWQYERICQGREPEN